MVKERAEWLGLPITHMSHRTRPARTVRQCARPSCDEATTNGRFCSKRCSAIVTNAEAPRRKRKSPRYFYCAWCDEELRRGQQHRQCCSQDCLTAFKRYQRRNAWLRGEPISVTSYMVKLWMIELTCHTCEHCGREGEYSEYTKQPVSLLELDHINGNNKDHRFENVQLLCSWCHKRTPTWGYNSHRRTLASAVEQRSVAQ
jgi:hypothetical protein